MHFPISCVIAAHATDRADRWAFMRFVGPNFAVGLVNMMAADDLEFYAVVCGAGYALSIPSEVLSRSILAPSLSGDAQSIAMARAAKGALLIARCMGCHTIKQRLARLLLQAHDCFGGDRPITLTQAHLAAMLMARRETVAEIFAEWKRDGVMESSRGIVRIRRVDELQRASCDCFAWVQRSYADALDLWKSIRWHNNQVVFR